MLPNTAEFIGTWAFPTETNMFLSSGTKNSCKVLGALNLFGNYASIIYFSSLPAASYFAVKYNFDERKLIKLEPVVHVLALGMSLALTIRGAFEGHMRPMGAWCGAVESVECDRCNKRFPIALFLYSLLIVFPLVTIFYVYFLVKKKIKAGYHFVGKKRIIEQLQNEKLQTVTKQCLLFTISFSIVAFMNISIRLIMYISKIPFWYLIIWIVLVSSKGSILFFVYEKTRSRRKKRNSAFGLRRHEVRCDVDSIKRKISNKKNLRIKGALEKPEISEKVTFSIFDGTPDPNSIWSTFIISNDSSEIEEASQANNSNVENEVISVDDDSERNVRGTEV